MYIISEPINGNMYYKFIDFLLERSDTYLFVLPNMGKTLVNERNRKLMSEYPVGYSYEEDPKLHKIYIKNTRKSVCLIEQDIISKCVDTGYLDQVTSIEMEVFHSKISDRTKEFLYKVDDFGKWLYPYFPEDICFFCEGKCIFQCVSHENLLLLYLDNRDVRDFLKKEDINFERNIKIKAPKLCEL